MERSNIANGGNYKQSNSRFISFALIENAAQSDGDESMEHGWDNEEWRRFLQRRFRPAGVSIYGYVFSGYVKAHLVKLHFVDCNDIVWNDSIMMIESYLNGTTQLPDCAPSNIKLKASRKYKHPNDLFEQYLGNDQQLHVEQIYGDARILNDFMTYLESQKHLQTQLAIQDRDTYFITYEFDGDDEQEFRERANDFRESLVGFRLLKVLLCEAYQFSGRSCVMLEYNISNAAKFPTKVLDMIQYKLQTKSFLQSLRELDGYTFEQLSEDWQQCESITSIVGSGQLYQRFKEEDNDLSIIFEDKTIVQDQVKEDDSMEGIEQCQQDQEQVTSKTRTFYCLQLKSVQGLEEYQALESAIRLVHPTKFSHLTVFQNKDNRLYYLCISFDAQQKGPSRQYFIDTNRKGYRLLDQHNVPVVTQLTCTTEAKFFAEYSHLIVLYGTDTALEQYKSNKLSSKQSAYGMQQHQQMQQIENSKLTRDSLLVEFHEGLLSGQFKNLYQFRSKYSTNVKALDLISKAKTTIQDLIDQFIRQNYKYLPEKAAIDSLREYVTRHPIDKQQIVSDQFLKEVGMFDILQAVLKVVVIADVKKVGTIIMHGVSNSGKSSIMNLLQEIFICHKYRETQGNFDFQPEPSSHKFQVLYCEETTFNKLFKPGNLENTKMFFERGGRPIECKGRQAELFFEGASNILASQSFPLNGLDWLDKEAIQNRCVVIELRTSHKSGTKFPLTTIQVADWLFRQYQIQTQQDGMLSVDEDELCQIDEDDSLDYDRIIEKPKSHKPMVLKPVPIGQPKKGTVSRLNSKQQVKKTERDIEWKVQKFITGSFNKAKIYEQVYV